jgi:hypothetical protein
MDKKLLIEKVKKGNFTPEQLLTWITCLPGSSATRKPSKNKIGDVYMHPVFQHPYVLLERKGDVWICGLFTTDSTYEQILEPSKSRFFTTSFFTKTLFTLSEPVGSYCNVFDNNAQIKSVTKQLKELFA